jgi:hypothetical protein
MAIVAIHIRSIHIANLTRNVIQCKISKFLPHHPIDLPRETPMQAPIKTPMVAPSIMVILREKSERAKPTTPPYAAHANAAPIVT